MCVVEDLPPLHARLHRSEAGWLEGLMALPRCYDRLSCSIKWQ